MASLRRRSELTCSDIYVEDEEQDSSPLREIPETLRAWGRHIGFGVVRADAFIAVD